jgi:hypothetical protein
MFLFFFRAVSQDAYARPSIPTLLQQLDSLKREYPEERNFEYDSISSVRFFFSSCFLFARCLAFFTFVRSFRNPVKNKKTPKRFGLCVFCFFAASSPYSVLLPFLAIGDQDHSRLDTCLKCLMIEVLICIL